MRFFCFIPLCLLVLRPVGAQKVTLDPAPQLVLPAEVDSNSPAFWNGQELVLYNSTGLYKVRSSGPDQSHLANPQVVTLGATHLPYWIEATWMDADGTLLAWYHHEPGGLCGKTRITAPEIGALVSYDKGQSFYDLGIVLKSAYPVDCSSPNGYFGGGNGDFTVVLSRDRAYFYFLFSNYGGSQQEQGVAVARMPFSRRMSPVGAVEKYYESGWREPGIDGLVTPIFAAAASWQIPETDAFWGPSVHFNSYLNKFVMLLNRSCCSPGWPQEGIYVSFNDFLSDPSAWTAPVKILDGVPWYPQVIGRRPNGTDKLSGKTARLYVFGVSNWEIVFDK